MKVSETSELRNLVRSLADVVSVDGWVAELEGKQSVHIDLSFRRGVAGGRAGDVVRFRLALLRAELVALNPFSQGISILPETVARERTSYHVKRAFGTSAGSESSAAVSLDTDLRNLVNPSAAMSFLAKKFRNRHFDSSATVETQGIEVNHRKDSDGNHRWEMTPSASQYLMGSGWDANEHPRFSMRAPRNAKISSALIFQVRCLREDMQITDIKICCKDKSEPFLGLTNKAKMVAAEAFIKNRLFDLGLVSGDISNPFAEICVFETVVET